MTEALLPFQPSLASATNTRLDSAARHNQQCRVSTDDMLMFVDHDHDQLQRQKYRYCIHKDEFVVGIGRPCDPMVTRKRTNNAYPRVVSNLGQWDTASEAKRTGPVLFKYMYHFARSLEEKKAIIAWFKSNRYHASDIKTYGGDGVVTRAVPDTQRFIKTADELRRAKEVIPMLTDQIAVGYANTLGWAHPNSGDTMVTVNIGGLRTVMNGDFEIFTGDLIQWYWPFEKDCFKQGGERKPYPQAWSMARGILLPPNVTPEYDPVAASDERMTPDRQTAARETYYNREFSSKKENIKLVARIKNFVRDDENPRIFDSMRVFGVALSCARPHEMVDIKICRQSL